VTSNSLASSPIEYTASARSFSISSMVGCG
jgi:hypothetical protein